MRYFQFSIILVLAAFALNACVDPDTTNLEIAGMFSGSSPRIKERFAQSQEYNNLLSSLLNYNPFALPI